LEECRALLQTFFAEQRAKNELNRGRPETN
jgi:hypothetical protein